MPGTSDATEPDDAAPPPSRDVAKLLNRNAFWMSRRGHQLVITIAATCVGVAGYLVPGHMSVVGRIGTAVASIIGAAVVSVRFWRLTDVD